MSYLDWFVYLGGTLSGFCGGFGFGVWFVKHERGGRAKSWIAPRKGGYSARATTTPHDPRVVPPSPGSASR